MQLGGMPSQWWEQDPRDLVTVIDELNRKNKRKR